MTTKLENRLDEILGIRDVGGASLEEQLDSLDDEGSPIREKFEMVKYTEVESKVVEAAVNPDTLDDYKYSRSVLYGLIDRGTAALEGALMVAKESEHPRAYETVSNMMKNISDMTKDLLQLQKALNPPAGKTAIKAETVNNIQNNTYNTSNPVQNEKDDMNSLLDGLDEEDTNNGS